MSQNHGRNAPAINSTKKSSLFEVPCSLSSGIDPIDSDTNYASTLKVVNGGQDRYRMRGRVSRLPGLTVGVVTDGAPQM